MHLDLNIKKPDLWAWAKLARLSYFIILRDGQPIIRPIFEKNKKQATCAYYDRLPFICLLEIRPS
jgi:hypothetical protein